MHAASLNAPTCVAHRIRLTIPPSAPSTAIHSAAVASLATHAGSHLAATPTHSENPRPGRAGESTIPGQENQPNVGSWWGATTQPSDGGRLPEASYATQPHKLTHHPTRTIGGGGLTLRQPQLLHAAQSPHMHTHAGSPHQHKHIPPSR